MDLDQIIAPRVAAGQTPPAYAGRVSRLDGQGAAFVVVPALSGEEYEHGPAKVGVPGPLVEGDDCLVIFDEARTPWVMAATPPVSLDGLVLDSDPRLSDSRTPTGPAGGDLEGDYPSPTVKPTTPGLVFATQRVFGAAAAYGNLGNGTFLASDAANAVGMSIAFTPPVDCWWETEAEVGLLYKLDAAWHYCGLDLILVGQADADGDASSLVYTAAHSAMPHSNIVNRRIWKLNADTSYTVTGQFQINGGTWQYYHGRTHLRLTGKAWAR